LDIALFLKPSKIELAGLLLFIFVGQRLSRVPGARPVLAPLVVYGPRRNSLRPRAFDRPAFDRQPPDDDRRGRLDAAKTTTGNESSGDFFFTAENYNGNV